MLLVQEKKFLDLPATRGRDARTPSLSLVAQDSAEHGGYCDRCSNAYENHGQLRVSMTAVVVYALHVRVTNGCGCVGLAIAHDKVFIAGAVNIALHFSAIVQRDGRARFRSHAQIRNAAF